MSIWIFSNDAPKNSPQNSFDGEPDLHAVQSGYALEDLRRAYALAALLITECAVGDPDAQRAHRAAGR